MDLSKRENDVTYQQELQQLELAGHSRLDAKEILADNHWNQALAGKVSFSGPKAFDPRTR